MVSTNKKMAFTVFRSPIGLTLLIAMCTILGQFLLLHYIEDYVVVDADSHLLLDSAMFAIITLPALYFFMYRPLTKEITRGRNAEAKAREAENDLKVIFDNMQDTCYTADTTGTVTWISPSVEHITGYSPKEVIGHKTSRFYLDPEKREDFVRLMERGEGVVTNFEAAMWRKDGSVLWISTNAHWARNKLGEIIGIEGVARDITEKKRAESQLQKSEQRFRDVTFTTGDVVWEIDTAGRFTFVSPQAVETLGYSMSEAVGKQFHDFIVPAEQEQSRKATQEMMTSMETFRNVTYTHRHKNGSTVVMEISGCPIINDEGALTGYRGASRDITKRIKSEEELRRLAKAVEHAGEVVIITDDAGLIQYANPVFETVTGYKVKEVLGKSPSILQSNQHPNSFYYDLWTTIKSGKPWSGHFINKKKNGELYEEDACIAPVFDNKGQITNYVAVKKDVTDIRLKDRETRQNQKTEAIEAITGGVAHNFNNLLSAIVWHTQVAYDKTPADNNIRADLEKAMKAGEKAEILIKQILMLGYKTKGETKPIPLHSVVKNATKLLRASMPPNITICEEIDTNSGLGDINTRQIEQAILNIGANAKQAMGQTAGTLTIKSSSVAVDEDMAEKTTDLTSGPYCKITISDTGSGMDSATLKNVFEPFFTTKKAGTGMGLSIASRIISAHGGAITVKSAPDKGTTFDIYIPSIIKDSNKTKDLPLGTELVLFIDTASPITEDIGEGLKAFGYQVVTRANCAEGVEVLSNWPEKFDILVIGHGIERPTATESIRTIPTIILTDSAIPAGEKESTGSGNIWQTPVTTEAEGLAQLIRQIMER